MLETVNRVHFVDLFSSETIRSIYNKTSQFSIIERLLLVNFFFIIANDYKIFKISNYRLWIRLDNVRRELTNVCSFKDKYVDTLYVNLLLGKRFKTRRIHIFIGSMFGDGKSLNVNVA